MKSLHLLVVAALSFAVASGCTAHKEQPNQLIGAGSTFVSPLVNQWSREYEKTEEGIRVSYEAHGSASGIRALLNKKVDFACTDAPLTDQEMAEAREVAGDVVHIPIVLGSVVPAFNLIKGPDSLRFSGPVLANIYLGRIKRWNDESLRKLNPGVELPDQEILVVHRSDGSGTTYIWTDYLAKVSTEWKEKVGVGSEVSWPAGVGEAGNKGIGERVKRTPGSIGYVELHYAYRLDLKIGLVQNREQEFVKGGIDPVAFAGTTLLTDIPKDLRFSLTDAPGKGSYPIAGATWIVVLTHQLPGKGRQLIDFLDWATGAGQEHVEELFYVPLPPVLLEKAKEKIRTILSDGKQHGQE
jgi:phosphate transport system substrate-binding protein